MQLVPSQILGRDVIDGIYDIEDELEKVRVKALVISRAKELKMERELTAVLKVYDKADKRLAEEYTRKNATANSRIFLNYDSQGKPLITIENFLAIIRNDEYFADLRFNLLTYSPEKVRDGKLVRWSDADDSEARNYVEKAYNLHSQPKLDDALRIVFREREYHPIKNIIEAQAWDGVERIPTFLIKWMKCEDSDYSKEVSRLIFAGGVNRLYNPGCKFDDVPVLIGKNQGEGKSSMVRWIALMDRFFGEITDIDGQRGIEALEGIWICEIAELLALTRTKDVEAVKSYITRQSDKYRRPFDRRVTEHKRQCIFIGTTNKEQFLTDKTGNRRFYPIKVNQSGYDLFSNEEEIRAEIEQCWTEALAKYNQGEMPPYADRRLLATAKEHQKEATEDDYREGMIIEYLKSRTEVCVLEIWQKALDNGIYSKPTRKDSNDIVLILQSMSSWERKNTVKRFPEYGVQKYWAKIQTHPLGWEQEEIDKNSPF